MSADLGLREREHYRALYMIDELEMQAPLDACFQAGANVEGWPAILPHYRWVRFHRKDGFASGRVEMAATRQIGRIPYPVWWVSEMRVDRARPAVIYRHVAGVTTGMDVEWTFAETGTGSTMVRIVHAWARGPHWPLPSIARRAIAEAIIGPKFIHEVASRTLRGVKAHVEGQQLQSGGGS